MQDGKCEMGTSKKAGGVTRHSGEQRVGCGEDPEVADGRAGGDQRLIIEVLLRVR